MQEDLKMWRARFKKIQLKIDALLKEYELLGA
jgi:hypothetical protein